MSGENDVSNFFYPLNVKVDISNNFWKWTPNVISESRRV